MNFIKSLFSNDFWDRDYFNKSVTGQLISGIWDILFRRDKSLSDAPVEIRHKAKAKMYGSVANLQQGGKEISDHELKKKGGV
jgi:hypothetical protein